MYVCVGERRGEGGRERGRDGGSFGRENVTYGGDVLTSWSNIECTLPIVCT